MRNHDPQPPQVGLRPVRCPVPGMGWLWLPQGQAGPFHHLKAELGDAALSAAARELVARMARTPYIANQVQARIDQARDAVALAQKELIGARIQLDRAEAELTELQSMLP